MKFLFNLGLIIFSLITTIAYADNSNAGQKASESANSTSYSKQDGKISAWFITLNKNEITAANIALKKTNNSKVLGFARFMISEHTKNLKQILQLKNKMGIQLTFTPEIKNMVKEGKKEASKLSSLSGRSFDKAYMAAMVKGHANALKEVDDKILPEVNEKTLKNYVENTRHHIETHLNKAEAIQAELQSAK